MPLESVTQAALQSALDGLSLRQKTIAANIALTFPEAYALNINVLIATGLILFIVTFAVNAVARWIVSRRKEFSGAN